MDYLKIMYQIKTNLAFPGWSSHTRCAADLSPLFLRTKTENVFRKRIGNSYYNELTKQSNVITQIKFSLEKA